MTNELEKQFFNEFDIKPKDFKHCDWDSWCPYPNKIICDDACPYFKTYMRGYPEITPNILLKLICILSPYCYSSGENIQHLKESVLKWCIKYKEDIKYQVRTLFKEG